MIAISRFLTKRITTVLSYLSVSCPLVAENSRNGRMKSAPITRPAICGVSQLTCSWYVTITVKANLNRLSLPAPRNWVQKNGAKRRWPSRANWFGCACGTAAGRAGGDVGVEGQAELPVRARGARRQSNV